MSFQYPLGRVVRCVFTWWQRWPLRYTACPVVIQNWKLWKEKYNNYFVISRLNRETPSLRGRSSKGKGKGIRARGEGN